MELTESETEYVVRCIKHTFANHMVFQVRSDWSVLVDDGRVLFGKPGSPSPGYPLLPLLERCVQLLTALMYSLLHYRGTIIAGVHKQCSACTVHNDIQYICTFLIYLYYSITVRGVQNVLVIATFMQVQEPATSPIESA